MKEQINNHTIRKHEAVEKAFSSEYEMATALSWAVIDLPEVDVELIADI